MANEQDIVKTFNSISESLNVGFASIRALSELANADESFLKFIKLFKDGK